MTKIKKPTIIILSTGFVLLPLLMLGLTVVYGVNKTLPNTYILDRNFSKLTREQVIDKLDSEFPLPSQVKFIHGQQEFSLQLASVSALINKEVMADNLLYRNLNYGLEPIIQSFIKKYSFPLLFSFDQTALEEQIASISSQLQKPFVPTELHVDKSTKAITAKVGEVGVAVDVDMLLVAFESHLINWQHQENIEIPTKTIGTIPTNDQIEATKIKATNYIGKSLLLKSPPVDLPDVNVDEFTLISWLDFDNTYNDEKISEFVDSISQSIKKDPVNAVFKFEEDRVIEFRPASDGHEVKQEELVALIIVGLDDLQLKQEDLLSIDIPTQVSEPELKTQDANDLGIKELLGSGVSTFKHSSTTRNFNIEKGASIVNRILVPPGETFSFLKHLGEVTLEAGYKKAYIIRQGRTELDVGGGICQVSTTLFRAMLNSGVNITHRRPHAFRVSYYEEDSPPGYDATIFIPSPDLAFVNDTGHHLLIQNIYDPANKKLTYEIFGTSDGRQVEISNYRQWGYAAPPPTRYIDDPTLEPGKLVKEETAVPGLKVAFDWKVSRGEEILHQQTFQSNYVPWAAVYRRGI